MVNESPRHVRFSKPKAIISSVSSLLDAVHSVSPFVPWNSWSPFGAQLYFHSPLESLPLPRKPALISLSLLNLCDLGSIHLIKYNAVFLSNGKSP